MERNFYDLTYPQKSIWLTEQYYSNTTVNNINGRLKINEKVDFSLLEKALNLFVKNNDAIRIKMSLKDCMPVQYIDEYRPFDIDKVKLNSIEDLTELEKVFSSKCFECIDSKLYRFILFELPDGTGGFIISLHHLVSDAWTMKLVVDNVVKYYSNLLKGQDIEESNFSYIDYIMSENEYRNSDKFNKDKEYWEEVFDSCPEIASLKSLAKPNSNEAKRKTFKLDKLKSEYITTFCKENKISPFTLFMGLFSIYLGRCSNLNEVIIGTPILNRSSFKEKHTAGMFISTVPFKIKLDDSLSFSDFIKNVYNDQMLLFRHKKYPYDSILKYVRENFNMNENLYTTIISYQNARTESKKLDIDYQSNWQFSNCINEPLDFHVYDMDDTGELTLFYDYQIELFEEYEIENIHKRLMFMLDEVTKDFNILLKNIEIITEEERNQILNEFNDTKFDYPKNKNIVELFEEQVEKTPNKTALVFENSKLTYKELNEKSNQLANYLSTLEIAPEMPIAIFLDKSLEVIISILAVLKVGACYLPIDINYPEQRIFQMLDDSNTKIILTNKSLSSKLNEDYELVDVELNSQVYNNSSIFKYLNKINSNNLAYIMYTSGSTGMPKGSMIEQKSIVRLVKNPNYITFYPNDRILQTGSIVFDACTFEIWGALLNGLELYIIPKYKLLDSECFGEYLKENKITILWLTSPLFNQLCNQSPYMFSDVRVLLTGGDILSPKHINMAKDANPNLTIINGYGPTENTTFSTCFTIDKKYENSIPIGKPISGSTAYVVSNNGNLLPVGIAGELWVGGDGVGRGYLNNIKQTKERFLENMFYNSKIYKTGDLVKWLPDGNIEFIGRIDNQIKIRGFRVELSEINYKILEFPCVKESVTIVRTEDGNKHICSYVVFKDDEKVEQLNEFLHTSLPGYMIPSSIVTMDALPINTNGKVNLKKLPVSNERVTKDITQIRNEMDEKIVNILKEILKEEIVDISESFVNLGLDSLSAISFSAALKNCGINVSVKEILNSSNIVELSDYITNDLQVIKDNTNHILPAETKEYYPVSSAQKRIYYASKLISADNLVYNVSGALLADEILDKDKIIEAFETIVNRHSTFRTSFVLVDAELKQKVNDEFSLDVPIFYNTEDNIEKILSKVQRPFDLDKDLFLRVEIHYLDDKKTLITIDSHHIVIDGLSLNIFIKEFCDLYNGISLTPVSIDYKDFAVWEDEFIKSENIKPMENYWLDKFKNSEIPTINLPYDYVRNYKSYIGSRVQYNMSKELFEKYENYAKELGVSSYSFFLSAFLVLLFKYTDQEELIVGSPSVGREANELKNIIGTFVNNIVLDAKMKPAQTFADFTKYIQKQSLDSLNNELYPYDLLVKKLSNTRSSQDNSIFDVAFVYQNIKNSNYSLNGKNINLMEVYSNTSKFNLTLEIKPELGLFNIEYSTSLFKKKTIDELLNHYLFLLDKIIYSTDLSIDELNIIMPEEEDMLKHFNATDGEINDDTVISIFEEQVRKTPNNVALICNNEELTYYELNKLSNSLAHYLISKGIKQNDVVCIMTNRSFETIICMLAILKAGAAFFNVDPTYPIERTKYYLENSKTKYVLTQAILKDQVKEIENCIEIDLNIDEIYAHNFYNPNIKINKEDLSYIIYTSGSTGIPKGVMLNQVGFANMVKAMTLTLDYLKEGNKHTIASVTSTPFDIFVYEIFVSLTHGLRVVMANNAEHRNPKLLDELIKKHNVDVMTVTPSLMKINYDNREPDTALANVKNMVFGGEPLPEKFVADLRALADDITIYNIYGPCEITVLSNVQNLTGEEEITVGPPIMNTQIHILNKSMKQVPIGVVGEIYISGIQVGCGYIGNQQLTEEKFLDNPFGPGKIYRSGDIGRWTFDGKVQCLGRLDNQIKLRGLRIELGEIENVIQNIEGVKDSVVNKIEIDNKEVLCGYYVSENVEENMVKEVLRQALPYYMVPTYFIKLEKMPYSLNRKIDRKALPLPDLNHYISKKTVDISKLNSNEDKLLHIWKNILKIDNMDIDDNFFDMGGDSISAINMQIEAIKYGIKFEYSDIFNFPTIRQLANLSPQETKDNIIDKYDYSEVNKLLSKNTIKNLNDVKKINAGNVFLIGGNGYLGAHIIDEYMKNNDGKIYCLIRPKNNKTPQERLEEILNFYFGDNYKNEFSKRIIVMNGEISSKNLGLSDSDYNLLEKDVDVVINSAAIVKHFGLKDEFEEINVVGTENVLDFCKKTNKRLLHVSTISISGYGEKDEAIEENLENISNKKIFTERNLYIGQHISGIYTTSKFRAELLVLNAISKGLDAQILRLGNITNRYRDGAFQINIENNAFAKRIQAFVEIGAIPRYVLKHAIELTPVDLAANAIITILNSKSDCNTFHIFNNKLLQVTMLIDIFEKLGIEITPVSNKLMADIISGIFTDDERKDIISGIIHDLTVDKKLIYTSNIRLDEEFTLAYLKKLGFEWKEIDHEYVIKYMNYFKNINFINWEDK